MNDQSIVLALDKISVAYGSRVVLRDVSLELRRGEVVAILGRSGRGKTTLLRVIADVEKVQRGSVARRCRVAMLFQEPVLQPWLSVRKNIALPGRIGRYSVDTDELLEQVKLRGCADAHIHELSGGMKRRVELARALAQRADLLLLDEPYASLDEVTAGEMYQQLLAIQKSRAISIVVVTHDIAEAMLIADRIVVIGGTPAGVIGDFAVSSDVETARRIRDAIWSDSEVA